MPFAACPQCSHQVQYLPEQTGMSGICPACNVDMVFRQGSRQIARTMVGAAVAVLSFAGLGFFGLMGGIVAMATHGGVAFTFVVLAVIFGMKVRDVFLIFAIYLGIVVLGTATVALDSQFHARKKRADGAIASPFFASLSMGMPLGARGARIGEQSMNDLISAGLAPTHARRPHRTRQG